MRCLWVYEFLLQTWEDIALTNTICNSDMILLGQIPSEKARISSFGMDTNETINPVATASIVSPTDHTRVRRVLTGADNVFDQSADKRSGSTIHSVQQCPPQNSPHDVGTYFVNIVWVLAMYK
jgi:hypothetical protein